MSLTNSYFNDSMGVLIVYDITRQSSTETLLDWLEQIKAHCDDNVVKFIVGNKTDLKSLRITTNQSVQEKYPYVYCTEMSALSNDNVESCFIKIAQAIQTQRAISRYENYNDSARPSIKLSTARKNEDQYE